jgi:two-component sensor histidine kinase
MRFFLNMLALGDFSFAWFYILAIESVMLIALFALARWLVLDRIGTISRKKRLALLFFIFGALGVIRTLFSTAVANQWGLENQGELWFFLGSGILFEYVLAIFWANVAVPYQDHKALVSQVQKTQDALLGYRENAQEILLDENQRLENLAQESLVPQIQKIEELIEVSGDSIAMRLNVVQELKAMINNQVRPLSAELRQAADGLAQVTRPAPKPFMMAGLPPAKFAIPNSIFPVADYVTMLLVYVAMPNWTLGVRWIPLMAVASISYLAILVTIKHSLSRTRFVSAWIGYPALIFVSQIALLPTFALVLILAPNTNLGMVHCAALAMCSFITFGAVAFFKSLEFQRARYVELLELYNSELAREAALFDQKLWFARRTWSTTLHGTVQSSLTAALTRFSSPTTGRRSFVQASQDLQRALDALAVQPERTTKLSKAVKDLAGTWRGICDVQVVISSDSRASINQSAEAAACVNEVLKEVVSNAVRHGNASQLIAQIVLTSPDEIQMRVENNGASPNQLGRVGIGSKIYDELTINWSLRTDETSGFVVFEAKLPIASPSSAVES